MTNCAKTVPVIWLKSELKDVPGVGEAKLNSQFADRVERRVQMSNCERDLLFFVMYEAKNHNGRVKEVGDVAGLQGYSDKLNPVRLPRIFRRAFILLLHLVLRRIVRSRCLLNLSNLLYNDATMA